jgi:hypothetical protein
VNFTIRAGAASLVAVFVSCIPADAADLVWQVENPFRLYKQASAFEAHERAFAAVRGNSDQIPNDIIWRMERHLNAPACRDPSTPATCAATVRNAAAFAASRLGWASRTLGTLCYDRDSRPRRYPSSCLRSYGRRTVKEDYIAPEAHAVRIGLAEALRKDIGDSACTWSWRPRAGDAQSVSRSQACKQVLVIERVPYAKDRARSGVAVEVTLPDGRRFADAEVIVEDLLVVALGDSFASGESNPDRPITFGNREFVYEPIREEIVTADGGFSLQSEPEELKIAPGQNPRALPRRRMVDEEKSEQFRRDSPEFTKAFYDRAAQWFSPDCHRSQYGYPVRVSLQLAVEDRRRAVTLVHLACSGAQVTEGLFVPQDAREDFSKPNSATVPAQFDQLTDLICRDGAKGRRAVSYTLPFFKSGQKPAARTVSKQWCRPDRRRRDIDLVLLSIGGNDIGFSAIAAYSMTESAGDIAPIAAWMGRQVRFGPDVARQYLGVLDQRMKAVKDALADGFGVRPEKVVQTSYEPIQFDETGALCGARPTLGLDVHPNLKLSQKRLAESAQFLDQLVQRLQCMSARTAGCPANLATGAGTGFTLVTEHHAAFRRRGICARDPRRAEADGIAMAMPRFNPLKSEFLPYHPAYYTPYGPRWRLFRTPNDAFLTANTHYEKVLLFDTLQPAYAALFSGAIHPTAEGHAIVADHVMPHARRVVGGGPRVEAARGAAQQ